MMSGGRTIVGSPGTKLSATPPLTSSTGTGSFSTGARASSTPSAASRASSCRSSCAPKFKAVSLRPRPRETCLAAAAATEASRTIHSHRDSPANAGCRRRVSGGSRRYGKRERVTWCRRGGASGRVDDRLVGGEAAQGVGLDLAHALPRDAELLADLLERGGLAAAEAEAQRDHVALPLGQLGDRAAHRIGAHRALDLVLGGRAAGGEQVAEARVAVGADRGVRRGDRLRRALDLADLVQRELRDVCDLLVARLVAVLREQLALGARDLLLPLDHVHRDADRAGLVGHAALDGLADPPRRVGRELEALAPVELLRGADQADDALLDQVAEGDALRLVAPGDRHDEPEVRRDHALLRSHVAALDPLRELDLLRRGEQRVAAGLVQEELERVGGEGRLGGKVQIVLVEIRVDLVEQVGGSLLLLLVGGSSGDVQSDDVVDHVLLLFG